MQVEFLGTGGAITTPRPGCECCVCRDAREKGVPFSRMGPSVFVHGPDVLIDTPEEIKAQLNRSRVKAIRGCFYSHWHPDHTMGLRVWEMNFDWRSWPRHNRTTDVYLPQQVAQDFRGRLGLRDHLRYLEGLGLIRVTELVDGETATFGTVRIRPVRLAQDFVYAFAFDEGGKRLLVAPDELFGWDPPAEVRGCDVAIVPMGILEFDPFTGERRLPANHPVLRSEATLPQTIEIVRALGAKRTILSHVEEPDGIGPGEARMLEESFRSRGLEIAFAHDTMVIDV